MGIRYSLGTVPPLATSLASEHREAGLAGSVGDYTAWGVGRCCQRGTIGQLLICRGGGGLLGLEEVVCNSLVPRARTLHVETDDPFDDGKGGR